MRGTTWAGTSLVAVLLGVVAWAEVVHARSSTRRLGSWCGPVASEVVVVLGRRESRGRAGPVNRYRVRAGLRSLDPTVPRSTLVLSGGPVGGPVSEAVLLAHHARCLGYTGRLVTEETSGTTWENVREVVPLLERADRIVVVSNSLHAEKARAYLWQMRPDLAEHLAPAHEHRFGEVPWTKVAAAVVGLRSLRRLRAAEALTARG